jgi:hypothetical protein
MHPVFVICADDGSAPKPSLLLRAQEVEAMIVEKKGWWGTKRGSRLIDDVMVVFVLICTCILGFGR